MHLTTEPPKYTKQKLTESKREMDVSTITIGNFNTLLSIMDRKIWQKIKKEIEDLNDTIS